MKKTSLHPVIHRRPGVARRARIVLIASLLTAPWFGSPALAELIDLADLGTSHPGFAIKGSGSSVGLGYSVSGAGDFNGDGIPDLVVGTPSANSQVGEAYIVFGKLDGTAVETGSIGSKGIRLAGIFQDALGASVCGAGDVDGDGFDDVIVGAPVSNFGLGSAFIIYGSANNSQPPAMAEFTGLAIGDLTGFSVSGAGDVNGDGLADVIIGAPQFLRSTPQKGKAYVIFGKPERTGLNLAQLGEGGFVIEGIAPNDQLGGTVSGGGDINGDGLADLLVAAPGRESEAGEVYVVFGKANTDPVLLGSLGSGGYSIGGLQEFSQIGSSLGAAGDVNGDGLADLILGSPNGQQSDTAGFGIAFVVFGKSNNSAVNLLNLGSGGFQVDDPNGSRLGTSVAGAGDVNGDGLSDVLVGATNAGFENGGADRSQAGEAYLIFGKTGSGAVSGADLGAAGVTILGVGVGGNAGRSVGAAGDVDGDGLADVMVGANRQPLQTLAGEAYLVERPIIAPASATYRSFAAPGDAPRTPAGTVGNGSDFSFPASRCWVDFAGGDNKLGGASLQTIRLDRNNARISNLDGARPVLWEITSDRTNPACEITFKYLDSEISGVAEDSLQLFHAPQPSGPWTALLDGFVRYPARNLLKARTESLGFFAIGAASVDADGDGLLDEWEREGGGIDVDDDGTIEYSLFDLGARPNRKDLFLEIDTPSGNEIPQATITMLVQAFAKAPVTNPGGTPNGITLHINATETGLISPGIVSGVGFTPAFDQLKDQHFLNPEERLLPNADKLRQAKARFSRYCIAFDDTDNGLAGQARAIPGADFYICLGPGRRNFPAANDFAIYVASKIMHELGHALGLGHGGASDDHINGKPNYPSVMNYALHDRTRSNRAFWKLDYSRSVLPTIDENSINETAGLQGGALYRFYRMPVATLRIGEAGLARGPILFPIDGRRFDIGDRDEANGSPDGRFTNGVVQDLNHFGPATETFGFRPSPGEVLKGHNDWANLKYEVPLDGLRGGVTNPPEEFPWEPRFLFFDSIDPHIDPETGWFAY